MSFVSSKGNILCRLVKIELNKILAIINRAIKGLHCTCIWCTDMGIQPKCWLWFFKTHIVIHHNNDTFGSMTGITTTIILSLQSPRPLYRRYCYLFTIIADIIIQGCATSISYCPTLAREFNGFKLLYIKLWHSRPHPPIKTIKTNQVTQCPFLFEVVLELISRGTKMCGTKINIFNRFTSIDLPSASCT